MLTVIVAQDALHTGLDDLRHHVMAQCVQLLGHDADGGHFMKPSSGFLWMFLQIPMSNVLSVFTTSRHIPFTAGVAADGRTCCEALRLRLFDLLGWVSVFDLSVRSYCSVEQGAHLCSCAEALVRSAKPRPSGVFCVNECLRTDHVALAKERKGPCDQDALRKGEQMWTIT